MRRQTDIGIGEELPLVETRILAPNKERKTPAYELIFETDMEDAIVQTVPREVFEEAAKAMASGVVPAARFVIDMAGAKTAKERK